MNDFDASLPNTQWLATIEKIDSNFPQTQRSFLKLEDKKVLVACSGGPDSVALALMCAAFDVDFGLAYIDHGLNAATLECEVLVKELSVKCDVPFFSNHLNLATDFDLESNIEATARKYRYESLEELRATHDYDIVLTAHHLDDVAETFLINLVRGSGSGISSLAENRNHLFRPILHWRKSELLELTEVVGIDCFVDEMNSDPRFVRNRMRNEVIPLLNDTAGRDVAPLIARSAKQLANDNEFLTNLAKSLWPVEEATTRSLRELDPVIQVHAIRAWIDGNPPSQEELDRIFEVVNHERTSTQISGHRTIWRTGAVMYQDVTPQLNQIKPKP